MGYELEEHLKRLFDNLELLNELIDDEDYFESDIKKYRAELFESIEGLNKLVDLILDEDPEIPIRHAEFRKQAKKVTSRVQPVYGELLQFSATGIIDLLNDVNSIIEDGEERPKIELFDQLTIPIMSLVNHQAHPTRPGYLVYHFKIEEHAAYFEDLLKEKNLFYERFDELRDAKPVYWFGVRDRDHDAVEIINYTVKGKFRKPMIHDKGARYFIVIFGILIVLFAIIGAIMSNT